MPHSASGTQKVFSEQEASTTGPDAIPTKGSRVQICSSWSVSGQEMGSGSSSPLRAVMVRAEPGDPALGRGGEGDPLLLFTVPIQEGR